MKNLNNAYMAEMSAAEMCRVNGGGKSASKGLTWLAIVDYMIEFANGFKEGWNESVRETGGRWK